MEEAGATVQRTSELVVLAYRGFALGVDGGASGDGQRAFSSATHFCSVCSQSVLEPAHRWKVLELTKPVRPLF